MVVGITIRLRTAIRIGQDTALGKNRRGISCQQHDAGGSGIMFPGLRVVPYQAAHRCARDQVTAGEFPGIPAFRCGNQLTDHLVVEVGPPQTCQRLRFERGCGLDSLLRNFVFVAGRSDAKLFF